MDNVNGQSEVSDIARIVEILVPIFFSLIAITGLFGNSLVIFVVIYNSDMYSTTNILIMNLAIADLLFVIFCIPFTAVDYILTVWPFGDIWCKIVQYLIVVTVHGSIYTLVLMSVDRFFAVVYPVSSRIYRTIYYAKLLIFIIWLIVLIISIPALFSHGIQEYTHKNRNWISCQFLEDGILPWPIFYIVFMSSSYLVPLALISSLYLSMISRLWRNVGVANMTSESYKGRKRITKLVIVVILAFALLWLPIQVILVLKSIGLYGTDTNFEVLLQIISQILAYSSSCVNPLLYAFLSENFRKAFKKVIYCTYSRTLRSSKLRNKRSSNADTVTTTL